MKITIEGSRGEGKSGLAAAIAYTLRLHGIDVSLNDFDGVTPLDRSAEVLRSLSDRNVKVHIEMKNVTANHT